MDGHRASGKFAETLRRNIFVSANDFIGAKSARHMKLLSSNCAICFQDFNKRRLFCVGMFIACGNQITTKGIL
jgi:hypothetical protein